MNRRAFLGTLLGGVAAASAQRVWPFRVYSIPSPAPVAYPEAWLLSLFNGEGFKVGDNLHVYQSARCAGKSALTHALVKAKLGQTFQIPPHLIGNENATRLNYAAMIEAERFLLAGYEGAIRRMAALRPHPPEDIYEVLKAMVSNA